MIPDFLLIFSNLTEIIISGTLPLVPIGYEILKDIEIHTFELYLE